MSFSDVSASSRLAALLPRPQRVIESSYVSTPRVLSVLDPTQFLRMGYGIVSPALTHRILESTYDSSTP